MTIKKHTADDFAGAALALLPPGAAWDWPKDGTGYALLKACSEEYARLEADIRIVLDWAIEQHRPTYLSWHISDYRKVAEEALAGITESMPRKMTAIGSQVGDRLWSVNAPDETWPVPLVRLINLIGTARVGSHAGDRLWGHRSRYILVVQYYRSIVDPEILRKALNDFKQSHIFLWFEDITGVGGYIDGQN